MPNPDRLAEIKRRARDVFEGTGGWTMSTDRTSVSDEDIAWLIEQVEAARRETWLGAAKVADARAKFLESVRTQSEGWFAISELKGIAAALRRRCDESSLRKNHTRAR